MLLLQIYDRFPRPDFESGYVRPVQILETVQSWQTGYVDIVILILVMILSVYAVFKRHSRRWIFSLSLFSLLYFGFLRKGCVCSVGSSQGVSEAIFMGVEIPFTTILLFFIPILVTLFFGRIYCGTACPLGALQELISIKQLRLPKWLNTSLKMVPPLFLGLAVLSAGVGSEYLICRWDPFVNIFRLTGDYTSLIYSGIFVVLSLVIYRPYCRFLCPYGFILRVTSLFSLKHLEITNRGCNNCNLCRHACPADEIHPKTTVSRPVNRKLLLILIVLLPISGFIGGLIGKRSNAFIAGIDSNIQLARSIRKGVTPAQSDSITAYYNTGKSVDELYILETEILSRYESGATIFGLFLGLFLIIKLISVYRFRKYETYETDRAGCINCGRCFEYCPKEVNKRILDDRQN